MKSETEAPRLPFWAAIVVAAASGAILDAAFPDVYVWPLVFPAVALLFWALIGRSFWGGTLVGFVGGAFFWGIHIDWLTLYLGPVPWLALAGLESIFFACGAGAIAVVLRRGPQLWAGRAGRLVITPLVVAALWSARESLTSVWPYGGFAWGRLALSQSQSPLGELSSWVGISGLSFLIAAVAAVAVQLLREPKPGWRPALIPLALIAVLIVVPGWPPQTSGSARVAAVQGNANAGLFATYTPGEFLNDHVSATLPLIGQRVDMVVWPENGTDIDPLRDPQARAVLDYISTTMDAPLIAGTITYRDGRYYNSSLLWKAGEGAVDIYDKVHPVPFAEYIPDREFWRPFAPDLIDLVGRDYAIGTRDNVFDIDGIRAGIAICFDIADDQLVAEMIHGGAELILAQTNNADFGTTDESVQQLAIARMRALETGRTVVNISTVGTSAMIAPDGSTIDELPTWTAGTMVHDVPLSTALTPAMIVGRHFEWLIAGFALAGLALSVWMRPRKDTRRG